MTKQYKITVNGKTYDVSVEEIRPVDSHKTVSTIVNTPVNTAKPAVAPAASKPAAPAVPIDENAISVKATMPGTILSFSVAVGDKVQEGQVVAILEAMKMENEITAPASGEVKSIHVEKGSSVVEGQVILQIK
ncbi:biotin/lipoyl-binding protein [Brachyspira hyodysenteriae]|uniref:biotin/lipoyl-containing protein n=1 Tax=Brachyspira hyodysenteriae TaxID=159 RepID=UPI001ADDD955|nr:biotin/lipoyl-containing protein [Brachyspira hyodysenteriae]MCZ9879305.1 biotin/lipoyl-binding protein [Brachyspira hyodysenteriae]MCZ9896902.1 biotin/lipoyl-binding protein [Brachyspira hyodysenteriae]QTM03757.1 biotin/lipoyl-binding protein [Brachyspira hyodysenteriae]QTM06322.1 biotin/lipoyl-binding protein [Brachyspira hyodysenteriae]